MLAALNAFYPGAEWKDTDGKPIQAHGGSVIAADGKYYFYGENKEKTDGVNGLWHWGMRIYSSTDLYNWKDEGVGKIARIVLKLFATEGEWEDYWRKRMDLNQSVMLNFKILEVR